MKASLIGVGGASIADDPLDKNFRDVLDELNLRKIPYWVCHGSLLGLVRDGNLIEWDHDIDFAVFEDEVHRELIETLMSSLGFEKGFSESDTTENGSLHFRRKGGRYVDFNLYLRPGQGANKTDKCAVLWALPTFMNKLISISSGHNKAYSKKYVIPAGILRALWPLLSIFVRRFDLHVIPSSLTGYAVPCRYLESFRDLSVFGIECRIPNDSESLCEYVYGPNWKIPRQNFNWVKDAEATMKVRG